MPFGPSQYATCIVGSITLISGFCLSSFVTGAFLHHHWGRFRLKSQLGPFVLVLMSALWAFSAALVFIANIINGDILYGWCQVNGISVCLMAGGTVFGHILLAFDRYFTVIHSRPTSWMFILLFVLLEFIYLIAATCIVLVHSPTGFIVMEGGSWCFYDFVSLHPGNRIPSIMVVVFCVFSSSFMNHAYLSVYLKTRQASKKMADVHSSSTAGKNAVITSDLEKRVFYRCLLIAGSFVCFFSPNFLAFLYRVVSGQRIPGLLDNVFIIWSSLDCICTPLLVCYLSVDFREPVLRVLPVKLQQSIEKWISYNNTSRSSTTTGSIVATT